MKTNMFKAFFTKIGTWMSKTAKAYIKARGIARSIIDAIEAAILGTAIGSFIINKIKLWRARRKLKKQLHNRGAENYTRDPDGLGMYDENGYRMTNTEIEKKNKELMDEIDELYMDDDIRDTVKLINKFDPDTFSGMTIDQQYRYVKNKGITFDDALKMFGLDKETQMKINRINSDDDDETLPDLPESAYEPVDYDAIEEEDDDDEEDDIQFPDIPEVSEEQDPTAWEEFYAKRKAAMERMSEHWAANSYTPEELTKEAETYDTPKETKIYPDFDYRVFYEMMKLYGCEDFTVATSGNVSKETMENYKKFSSRVIMTNAFISYVYCYNKPRWTEYMHLFKYDTNAMWRDLMRRYYYDEKFYHEVYKELHGKEGLLHSNAKGHFSSNRPPILSLADDAIFVKVEKLYEKFEEEQDMIKSHLPQAIRDDDFDEQLEDYKEFFGIEDDDKPVDMSGTEDILDQLDILRSGEANSIDEYMEKHQDEDIHNDPKPEQETEEVTESETVEENSKPIRKPVKMITHEEPEEDPSEPDDAGIPSVIVMAPNVYTLERRAKMMLDIYAKLHQVDENVANNRIQNMLDDDEMKNYHYFEVSMIMQQYRKEDREHNLPFKILPCDYHNKEEMLAIGAQFQTGVTIYGMKAWKALVDDRTEFYRDKFEVETVDAMMHMIKDYDMDHQIKVDLVRYMLDAGYENCVELANIDDLYEEAIAHPADRIQALYIEDYDGEEEFEKSDEESGI